MNEEEQRNEIQQGTGRNFFEIVSQRDRDFGNFPLKGIEISIRGKAGTKNLTLAQYVEELFSLALEHLLSNVDPQSRIGFSIQSSNAKVDKEVFIPWRKRVHLNV